MKLKLVLFTSLLVATLLSAQTSSVPKLMSYQGRVTDAAGSLIGGTSPVNRTITFRLYGQPSDGSALYAETQTVTISGGEFSVLIGNGTGVSGSPGPSTPASEVATLDMVLNAATTPLYLGITVDDGNAGTVDAEIAPRQQLVSGAYALRAAVAERVASGAVTTDMLGSSSVSTANLQAHSVTSSRIADGGIATVNVADSAITAAKLDAGSIGVWAPSGPHVYRNSNVGIGQNNPGFPLNFANSAGPKISLYGNSGNHYGFGIQSALLEIYTSGSGSDIAFGYGTSGSLTESMRIKGNGNVGIGTSAPTEKLHIREGGAIIQSTGNPYLKLTRGDSSYADLGLASAAGSWSDSAATNDTVLRSQQKLHLQSGTGSAALSIDSANRIGIGNSSPNAKLTVGANLAGSAHSSTMTINAGALGTSHGSELVIASFGSTTVNFSSLGISAYRKSAGSDWHTASILLGMDVDSTKRMGGYLAFGTSGIGIGTTDPTYPLDISGGTTITTTYGFLNKDRSGSNYTGAGTYSLRAANRIMAAEFNAVSDARLKSDITPILESDAMDFVNNVSAVKYRWKDGEDKGLKFGFIAQDLVKAGFNNMVGQAADPEMKEETDASGFTSPAGARFSVNYEMVIPMLLVAIKQLKTEADLREARIEELEHLNGEMAEKDIRINDLEQRLAAIEEHLLSR